MIRATNTTTDFKYYVNTSKTIVFSHNIKANKITRVYKSDWASLNMEVLKINEKTGNEKLITTNWDEIIKEDNDIFAVVKPIASTTKQAGYFEEYQPNIGLTQNCLNEYLNSERFIKAKENVNDKADPLQLLENNCPNISLLLSNLFYGEEANVLQNFLNWLAVITYKNERQDVFWLFKGTDENKQGQGAGKGVFRDLMTELLSGLVVSVNNQSYKNNFNSKLMNMKLIIFDEVNFQSLNYEVVKDMTGSNTMPIEFKGKETMETDNVASWLFFTNMHKLFDKINAKDRRCFLIHPNPDNDSLNKIVENMEEFINTMQNELPEFINVLAHCDTKVIKPQNLTTNAHKEHFNNAALLPLSNVSSIANLYLNPKDRDTYFDFLEQLEIIDDTLDYANQRYFIEKGFTYYKLFEEIYGICYTNNIAGISSKITAHKAWKDLTETLRLSKYEAYKLDRKTKIDDETVRIKESCWRMPTITAADQKKITNRIVKMTKEQYTAVNNLGQMAS